MKRFFIYFIFLFLCLDLHSQTGSLLRFQQKQLDFGTVKVGEKDSLQLFLENKLNNSIRFDGLKFYSILDENPFFAPFDSLTLAPNTKDSIWVYFEPQQNILHNSELVIQYSLLSTLFVSGGERAQVFSMDLKGQGRFPLSYYDTTENLSEEALKKALNYRLGLGYRQKSYNEARDSMFMKIDNKKENGQAASVNTIEGVYTGHIKSNYSSRSNAQTSNPNYNTEHTFPQGFFNQRLPERSDLHHLFPTTNNANSQRGNKPFGEVSNGTAVTLGGGSFFTNTTFEPRDEQKGRTARAMMYFVLRYQDFSNHFSSQENTLKKWHADFPPDSIEERRNVDIFKIQNNRNPFVDYPQLEKRISNFVSNSSAPTIWGLDVLQSSVNFNTLRSGFSDTLNFVMVNTGNQDIIFSNFSLSDTSKLSFMDSSKTADTIEAGDAIKIGIKTNSAVVNPFSESLTFNTNIPGSRSSFTVPVIANTVLTGLDQTELEDSFLVFPNPFEDRVFIEFSSTQLTPLSLFDAMARLVWQKTIPVGQHKIEVNTENFRKGVYFLSIQDGDRQYIKKLIH